MSDPRDYKMPTKDPDKTDETDHVPYELEGGFVAPKSVIYYGNGDPVEIKIPTSCPVIEKRKKMDEILEDRNRPHSCQHKWKTIALITSYATYCEICGVKQ